MRILLDTNVWVAAFLTRGNCQELLEYLIKSHQLLSSAFILKELKSTLGNKLKFPVKRLQEVLNFVASHSLLVDEQKPIPEDIPIIRPDQFWEFERKSH